MQSFSQQFLDNIVSVIADKGYIVLAEIIPVHLLDSLIQRIKQLKEHELQQASIGRGNLQQKNNDIRQDSIYWLDKNNSIDKEFLELMDSLRAALNRYLYLGLFDYECHYAIFKEGAFYKKHIDALKGKSNRVLSTVIYLNKNWQATDEGELVIFNEKNKTVLETVVPKAGTMVIFLSEQFPHEVRPAKKMRYSIAGWFRLNASDSSVVDPIT